jgi:ABC-type Fe3+-siderophore transport system permease subunit
MRADEHIPSSALAIVRVRKNAGMEVNRIAWLATVFVALLTALLLLLSGYTGYAGLGVAVAASAAINLL